MTTSTLPTRQRLLRRSLLRVASDRQLLRDASGWFYVSDVGGTVLTDPAAAEADALLAEGFLEVPVGAQRVRVTEKGRLEMGGPQ